MDIDEILNTLPKHKSKLDKIYRDNRKRDYIKGYDGINHCFVIRLLPANIQMKMLEKLSEAYSKRSNTVSMNYITFNKQFFFLSNNKLTNFCKFLVFL